MDVSIWYAQRAQHCLVGGHNHTQWLYILSSIFSLLLLSLLYNSLGLFVFMFFILLLVLPLIFPLPSFHSREMKRNKKKERKKKKKKNDSGMSHRLNFVNTCPLFFFCFLFNMGKRQRQLYTSWGLLITK